MLLTIPPLQWSVWDMLDDEDDDDNDDDDDDVMIVSIASKII